MKILHVAPSLKPEWGGVAKVVKGLTESLAKKGIRISIFAPSENNKNIFISDIEGVDTRIFPEGFFSKCWPGYSKSLAEGLKKEIFDFDLMHIHGIWHYPNFAGYQAARFAGKPFMVTVHGKLEPWCLNHKAFKKKIYSGLIQRKILREASALHAITDEEVKNISRFVDNKNIFRVNNGLNTEEFEGLPERERFGDLHPEVKGKKVILFLGRIHPVKGLDLLARAFGDLLKVRRDVQLVIAGPDENGYRGQITELLKTENALSSTSFTGMITGRDKLAAFSGTDILVLPSYSEVLGLSVLEAMACGIPVIITSGCNFPEVEESCSGIVIGADHLQLSSAIKKLLDDEDLGRRMGERGRKFVKEKFDWDRVSDEMVKIYEKILTKKK